MFTFLLGLVTLNWKLSGRRSALKDLTSDLLERQKMPQDHFLRHDCHYVKIQHETLKLEKKIEAVEESPLEIQERAWGGAIRLRVGFQPLMVILRKGSWKKAQKTGKHSSSPTRTCVTKSYHI